MAAKLRLVLLIALLLTCGCSAPWSQSSPLVRLPWRPFGPPRFPNARRGSQPNCRPRRWSLHFDGNAISVRHDAVAGAVLIRRRRYRRTVPTPTSRSVRSRHCCGVFAWVDDQHLLVLTLRPMASRAPTWSTSTDGQRTVYRTRCSVCRHARASLRFPILRRGHRDSPDRRFAGFDDPERRCADLDLAGRPACRVARDLGVSNTSSLVEQSRGSHCLPTSTGADVRSVLRFEASACGLDRG